MPEIRLGNLITCYRAVEVLNGTDLSMAENEFTVLVGPSGCGKSTTLRMIAGLETVTEEEIYLDDQPISHLEPKDRNLAIVFQNCALYPHMDVAQNILFALRLQKRPKAEIEAKVREVADIVGITDFLHRKPGALSAGQRQPVKNNMINVTHDQIEAMTLADRIVVMHGGYIQQQGTPEVLFKHPKNKFVAGFLGSPPMNFLEVNLRTEGDTLFTVGNAFKIAIPASEAQSLDQTRCHVILGVRPSDLIYDPSAQDAAALDLQVKISEYIGAQPVLLCACGRADVTVELKSETPIALGETLRFAVRPEGIHLFDRETELAL